MAQQINLHPTALGGRASARAGRPAGFGAKAMALALGVLALGLVGAGIFLSFSGQRERAALAAVERVNQAERQRLQAAVAARPAIARDTTALGQELAQAQQQLAERRRMRASLGGEAGAAALLKLVARTAPPPLWLTGLRRSDERIELSGLTRDPAVLQPWLAQLAGHPALMGRALSAVQVERSETDVDAWRFVVASAAPAATTTATATPAAAPKGSAP